LSADSRQFYKELSIGTAKPTEEQLAQVQHFFVNTKSVSELYGAGHFEKDATELLTELYHTRDIVFLTGGSGLYINAVLHGVDDFIDVPDDIRQNISNQFAQHGIAWLRETLKKLDPQYFEMVDLNNPQRIARAIEVSIYTGSPYSSFLNKPKKPRNFLPVKIMIDLPRQALYERINARVDNMMKEGLLEEVAGLTAYKTHNALKTVGYKELFAYLENETDLETAVLKIKQHTRNYAKRQLTWFKNQDDFESFGPHDFEKIKAYIDLIMQHG
jgi:tRNA dimethylallyltransferase